jgi:hypothetical protein
MKEFICDFTLSKIRWRSTEEDGAAAKLLTSIEKVLGF